MDYITLQRRIWNELDRTDITAVAQDAIKTAIRHYAWQRLFFNEERWTSTTVADQEFYAFPSDFRDIDSLRVTVSDNDYVLFRRDWSTLEDWVINPGTYTGFPTDYAIFRNELRLYPVPNGAYTLHLSGQRDLSALENDSDTNDWLTHGEELIRSRACADLIENIIQDYDEPRSVLYKRREADALDALRRESTIRLSTGRSRKARW